MLPPENQCIIKPVVQRDAYFAHPSTMLCAGLASGEPSVRRKAVDRNHLQWDAGHWWDIINWETAAVHQPAILNWMSNEELELALNNPVQFPGS